jgi:hypothetical protein
MNRKIGRCVIMLQILYRNIAKSFNVDGPNCMELLSLD